MIVFNLLCDLKEVESKEHHIQSSNLVNITLTIQVSHYDSLSLGPTTIMDFLDCILPHSMGKEVTTDLKLLL